MSDTHQYDLIIKNARVVQPVKDEVIQKDIGIRSGKIYLVAPDISVDLASSVDDAQGKLVFPGLVDAHMHVGIYSPLHEDAVTESKAAAMV